MFDLIKKYQIWGDEPLIAGFLRETALEKITPAIGSNLIKVICGQRRCGKSFLIRQIINMLVKNKISKNKSILYINMEYGAFNFLKDYKDLFNFTSDFKNNFSKNDKCFLFIDEVQKIDGWERAVNSLAQDFTEEWEIFISSSNASLLSGELSTLLSGRYVTYILYPFSFIEYCGITENTPSLESFSNYMMTGGMPECFKLPDNDIKNHYISDLRDSIILRDIVKRYQIRDVRILDGLIELLIDSVGSYFSITGLANTLISAGIKSNPVTIGNYIEYLKDVFFIHEIPKYDVAGKKILTGERKFYLNDPSFRFYGAFIRENTPGKYLENAVLMHLLREGYSVQAGSISGKEIDFVAKKNSTLIYVQAAYMLNSEKVIDREFKNLEMIKDNYRKMVVTLDPVSFGNRSGVEHFRAWKWIK